MDRGKSNVDKTLIDFSDDEELSQDEEDQRTQSSESERSEKRVNLLDSVKNFFKNHPLGKSSSENVQCKNKQAKKIGDPHRNGRSRGNRENVYDDLFIKNSRNRERNGLGTNGQASKRSGRRETSGQRDSCPEIPCKVGKVVSDRNAAAGNGSLSSPLRSSNVSIPAYANDHVYENLKPTASNTVKEEGSNVASKRALPERGYRNSHTESNQGNNREGTNQEQLINRRREGSFLGNPSRTAANGHLQRSVSANYGRPRRPERARSSFRVMRFIRDNVRKLSLPDIHSGAVVLLNDPDGRASSVTFGELRPDIGPIRVDTETYRTLRHARLMSGGSVVLEGFSDGFAIPDFYAQDPVIFETLLPDELLLPETPSVFENVEPYRPVLARSCSGGGVVVEDESGKTSLPELFPTKKTPPPPELQRPLSGGGLVGPNEVQNEIFLDLLSQSLRFEVGQSANPSPNPYSEQRRTFV